MRPLLVLLVQGRLFHDHLLEQVLFGLKDEDFAQALLMLLHTKPLVMIDLGLGDVFLVLDVHIKHRFVNLTPAISHRAFGKNYCVE